MSLLPKYFPSLVATAVTSQPALKDGFADGLMGIRAVARAHWLISELQWVTLDDETDIAQRVQDFVTWSYCVDAAKYPERVDGDAIVANKPEWLSDEMATQLKDM